MMKALLILALLPSVAFGAAKKWTYPESPKLDDELANVYAGINAVPNGIFKASTMTLQGITVDSATINKEIIFGDGTTQKTAATSTPLTVVSVTQCTQTTNAGPFTGTSYNNVFSCASPVPKSSSSRFIVYASGIMIADGTNTGFFTLARNTSTNLSAGGTYFVASNSSRTLISHWVVDSPSSASAVTYNAQVGSDGTHNVSWGVNTSGTQVMILVELSQ